MKYISHILAIAVMLSVIVPCSDAHESDKNNLEQCYQSACDQQSDEHQDFCSPFCTCQCCHINIGDSFNYQSQLTPEVGIQTGKLQFLDNRIAFSIWEPPPYNE